ncbi:hypothetical protein [Bradyrhizobium sp. NBAIM01]|uniref:hypothetical protein n=1 Tax=Bradyrhizobium sp. NBAIM01 TaxID=2793818 RepID=UPI001CD2C21B|nr:hypothetical protein [Bradyrhizobium sp. NBAIM01]
MTPVEPVRNHERVGIERADRIELGPVAVVGFNAREIGFEQRRGSDMPIGQSMSDIAHRRMIEPCMIKLWGDRRLGADGRRGNAGIAAG